MTYHFLRSADLAGRKTEMAVGASLFLCVHRLFLSKKTSADFHNMVNTCCDIDCASQRTSKIVTFNRIQTINTTESTS